MIVPFGFADDSVSRTEPDGDELSMIIRVHIIGKEPNESLRRWKRVEIFIMADPFGLGLASCAAGAFAVPRHLDSVDSFPDGRHNGYGCAGSVQSPHHVSGENHARSPVLISHA